MTGAVAGAGANVETARLRAASDARARAGTCVDPATFLMLSVDVSEGGREATEKILFEGDEVLRLSGGGGARACDVAPGDQVAMASGRKGRITAARRRPRGPAPSNDGRDLRDGRALRAAKGGARAERVYATSDRVVTELVHLHTSASDVDTTRQHPFYVEGRGFVPAGELHEGDRIRTRDLAHPATLLSAEIRDVAPVHVYNMRVGDPARGKDDGTYYAGGMLVHNGDCVDLIASAEGAADETRRARDLAIASTVRPALERRIGQLEKAQAKMARNLAKAALSALLHAHPHFKTERYSTITVERSLERYAANIVRARELVGKGQPRRMKERLTKILMTQLREVTAFDAETGKIMAETRKIAEGAAHEEREAFEKKLAELESSTQGMTVEELTAKALALVEEIDIAKYTPAWAEPERAQLEALAALTGKHATELGFPYDGARTGIAIQTNPYIERYIGTDRAEDSPPEGEDFPPYDPNTNDARLNPTAPPPGYEHAPSYVDRGALRDWLSLPADRAHEGFVRRHENPELARVADDVLNVARAGDRGRSRSFDATTARGLGRAPAPTGRPRAASMVVEEVDSLLTSGTREADGRLTELVRCGVLRFDPVSGELREACFVAGTAVATPDGARAIEQIEPGDFVLAAESEGGDVAKDGRTAPAGAGGDDDGEARPEGPVEASGERPSTPPPSWRGSAPLQTVALPSSPPYAQRPSPAGVPPSSVPWLPTAAFRSAAAPPATATR